MADNKPLKKPGIPDTKKQPAKVKAPETQPLKPMMRNSTSRVFTRNVRSV